MKTKNTFYVQGDKIYYKARGKEVDVTDEAVDAVKDMMKSLMQDSDGVTFAWSDAELSLKMVGREPRFCFPDKDI